MSVFQDIRRIAIQLTEAVQLLKAVSEQQKELIRLLKEDQDPPVDIRIKEAKS